MNDALVIIEGLTKRFAASEPPAIDGLTTAIRAGQVTGLVGPDGAGKTTLMRLVAALLTPSEGKVTVCGFDAATQADDIHDTIGYMPQRFGLYEDLSVIENLDLYADLRGVSNDSREQTFDKLLAFTDLARFTDRRAGALSGGMKQKLGLACAMLRSPRLLLLDEPSVGVDPISRRELWRMVYALIGEGVGVVWSTAYLDEAENCAEVIVLNGGRVLFQGDPKAMTASMAGRVFQLHGAGAARRALLAQSLKSPDVIDGVIDEYITPHSLDETWDIPGLEQRLQADFNLSLPIAQWLAEDDKLYEELLRERIVQEAETLYNAKKALVGDEVMNQFEKSVMMQTLDNLWKEHLAAMDHLRQGIHLRGYAQKNPKQEYKRESFELFTQMLETLKQEVVSIICRVQVQERDVDALEEQRRRAEAAPRTYTHADAAALNEEGESEPASPAAVQTPFVRGDKVGRNDPCPCGSGKKYKQCHGQLS